MAWIEPVVLEGSHVRLTPMRDEDAAGLAALAEPNIYAFFLGARPEGISSEDGLRYVRAVVPRPNTLTFTVRSLSTGEILGSTSYLDIQESNRCLEIGSTWLAPRFQGTAANPEMKFLMLRHAFESLACVRVQLKTDSRNLQSQRAIEKLGAVKEGILRKYGIFSDGYVRDAVMYSITADEWPTVRERLLARLAAA